MKSTSNDAWAAWLDAYAGEAAHRLHDDVHTLVLGRELLINIVREPGPAARVVIFSTPGYRRAAVASMAARELAPPDLVEVDGSRRSVSIDPVDGMMLLSSSVFADALDEEALHAELTRHTMRHLLWAALHDRPALVGGNTQSLPEDRSMQRV